MKTQGLLLLGILAESNGTLKTTMPRFTDVQTLKTESEGMIFYHFFWPPHSPYLNPVENVWYVLKNAVSVSFFGSTVLDLECALSVSLSVSVSVCLCLSLSLSVSPPPPPFFLTRQFLEFTARSFRPVSVQVPVRLSASSEIKETHNSLSQAVSKFGK